MFLHFANILKEKVVCLKGGAETRGAKFERAEQSLHIKLNLIFIVIVVVIVIVNSIVFKFFVVAAELDCVGR